MSIAKLGKVLYKGLKNTKLKPLMKKLVTSPVTKKAAIFAGVGAGVCKYMELNPDFTVSNSTIRKRADFANQHLHYNPDEYTQEALEKRYPSDKYRMEVEASYNYYFQTVYDKNTNKKVLEHFFSYDLDGLPSNSIYEYDENEEKIISYHYDDNKVLKRYDDKDGLHYPIADLIHADICAKKGGIIPTTGKDIETHIKMITPNNVDLIYRAYKKQYGKNLEDAINFEWGLDADVKRRLIAHISDCYDAENKYKKEGFTNEHSKIENDYYKGDEYSVVQKGNRITATNKNTGKVSELNIYDLVKDLPLNQKSAVKAMFQRLPGEVIADFVSEGITNLNTYNDYWENLEKKVNEKLYGISDLASAEAYYNSVRDDITLVPESYVDSDKLIHELGHALDFRGKIYNENVTGEGSNFYKAFQKDLETYRKKGFKTYDEIECHIFTNPESGAYATSSELEMFAECYTLLMTGKCDSSLAITRHFKNTLNEAKKIILQTRKLPDKDRQKM